MKTNQEMQMENTFNPQLAPKSLANVSPRRDLTKRDQNKLQKISQQKIIDAQNEVKECTFEPKLNLRESSLRIYSARYIDSYLYKPKPRVDRRKQDIEYELQKNDCKFVPALNKKA